MLLLARRTAAAGATASALSAAWLQRNFAEDGGAVERGGSVLVVGGGIAGVTAAHELGRLGYQVTVLEESEVGGFASATWGNAGTIGVSTRAALPNLLSIMRGVLSGSSVPAGSSPPAASSGMFFDVATLRDPFFWLWGVSYLRTLFSSDVLFASDRWRQLTGASQAATFALAASEGLTQSADMRIDGRTTVRASRADASATHADADADADALRTVDALAAREPHMALAVAAPSEVLVSPEDGQGSCAAFTRGLAQAAITRHRVAVEAPARAASLIIDAARGRVSGVRLENGEERHADAVVLCAGARTAALAASAGVYVPIQPLRGYSLSAPVIDGARSVHAHVVYAATHLYVTRLGDELRFACYGEMVPAGTRTGPSAELTAALHALVENQCPNVGALCDWAQAVPWHGDRPLTPDCQPLVGRTRIPGLYVHAGHSFNGWRDATLSARVLGRAVSGEAHPRDDAPPSSDEAAIRLAARVYAPHRFQPWPPSQ